MNANKKKKLTLISVFASALALSLGLSATLTYLGKTTEKKNKITVGHGDIEISETFTPPTEASMISKVEKKFSVKNTGTVPSFARLYAEFSDSEVAGKAKVKLNNRNTSYITEEYTWAQFKELLSDDNTSADSLVLKQKTKWRYVSDSSKLGGYFYYSKLLNPGDSSEELFDSVTVDFKKYDAQSNVIDNSNIDRIVDYEMIVYSEIVQNIETGYIVSNGASVYGYEYKDGSTDSESSWHDGEWKEAWRSFLRA